MAKNYIISGVRLSGIADQVRRIAEISDRLSPAGIQETLEGIEPGGGGSYMLRHVISQAEDAKCLTAFKRLEPAIMYRYGGILLPKLPQDILETHPYCFIRDAVGDQGVFSLFMSRTPWLYMTVEKYPVLTTDSWQEGIYWYNILSTDAGNVATWTLNQINSTAETYNVNTRPLIWTNQNITSLDEADAGTVKHYWSMPVVPGEE